MATRPHDLSDLYLSPVALALDQRIEEFGAMDVRELALNVAIASNRPEGSRAMREDALLIAIAHLIDCHGWLFSWDARGVRITNADHTVVLGAPPVFADYLAGAHQDAPAVSGS
jgi:hypothetical protein